MELRTHGDVGALVGPTGMIPEYEVLEQLFKEVLGKEYSRDDYINQFTLRVPENISKLDRVVEFHQTKVGNTPKVLFEVLRDQRKRLEDAQAKHGDYISPFDFPSA